jgi:hypothetical protein
MAERHITRKDAEEIGDAVARSLAEQDPAQRLERRKRELGASIRQAASDSKRERLERFGVAESIRQSEARRRTASEAIADSEKQ